jgi:hypothetical protein
MLLAYLVLFHIEIWFSAQSVKYFGAGNQHKAYILADLMKIIIFPGLAYNNNNSMALVRERTIPAERPPLVGEVNANFCG